MKFPKVVCAVILAGLISSGAAWADDNANGRFIGGVGLGGAALGNGFGSAYSGGGGIDGYIGFTLNRNTSLLLAIDSFIFSTNDANVYSAEVNFVPSIKYAFGDSKTRFYLIGGLGSNDNILYYEFNGGAVSASQRNFVIEPGAGVQIFLNGALNLYIQAKYVDVFASSAFSYFPITVGLDFK